MKFVDFDELSSSRDLQRTNALHCWAELVLGICGHRWVDGLLVNLNRGISKHLISSSVSSNSFSWVHPFWHGLLVLGLKLFTQHDTKPATCAINVGERDFNNMLDTVSNFQFKVSRQRVPLWSQVWHAHEFEAIQRSGVMLTKVSPC